MCSPQSCLNEFSEDSLHVVMDRMRQNNFIETLSSDANLLELILTLVFLGLERLHEVSRGDYFCRCSQAACWGWVSMSFIINTIIMINIILIQCCGVCFL